MKKEKLIPLTVTILPKVKVQLKVLAARRKTTLMDICRELIENYIKEAK